MIAFYYALTGAACVIHYRRELLHSPRNLLFMGVAPAVGAVVLGYLWVKATIDYADPETSYTGSAIFGIGLPTVIGIGFLLLGFVLLIAWRLGGHPRFFSRGRFEAVEPVAVSGSG